MIDSESDISMELWRLGTLKDDFKKVFDLDLKALKI